MGEHFKKFEKTDRLAFLEELLNDIKALDLMLKNDLIEKNINRIGAEQEFCLIDPAGYPANNALQILEQVNDKHFTTELALYNLEINLDPFELKENCFTLLHHQLKQLLKKAQQAAQKQNTRLLLTGILPTIGEKELQMDFMTPIARYKSLNREILDKRGKNFYLHFKGVDELSMMHDNVLFEACNTSFQLHLQIQPAEFVNAYNWSQAISGPVLAVAVNAPMLLGRELWKETRIALFQQSIDIRNLAMAAKEKEARVSFGTDWIRESVTDIFKRDISNHSSLLCAPLRENPLAVLEEGKIPKLKALCLFNGTIYHWNRACYGVGGGKPHLRIENRYIPSGPSTDDEIANFVFWVGLMMGRPKEYDQIWEVMEFKEARANFIKGARYGIETLMDWGGEKLPVGELVKNSLLPIARQGLKKVNVDTKDVDYYLHLIEMRLTKGTGAEWQIKQFRKWETNGRSKKYSNLAALTNAIFFNQQKEIPLHKWEFNKSIDELRGEKKLVKHYMSSTLLTVNEKDSVALADKIMTWNKIHHLPVEDDNGKLKALLNKDQTKRLWESGGGKEIAALKLPFPVCIQSTDPIEKAQRLMQEHDCDCLPVLYNNELVGILTSKDL